MANKQRMRRCHEGKQRFTTLQEAKSAAAGMVRRKSKSSGTAVVTFMRAYGCACGGFHFGKTRGINWDLVGELSVPKKVA